MAKDTSECCDAGKVINLDESQLQRIEEIRLVVESACLSTDNRFGYGSWTHHIMKVVDNATQLAKLFNANEEVVCIAALLHDYSGIKDYRHYQDHHEASAVEARTILTSLGFPQEEIDAVAQCIRTHRASHPMDRSTPEAECLANADAVSHIQQIPSLLYLAFVEYGMGIDEGACWVRNKILRSWKKLSPSVQEAIRPQFEAALKVLTTTQDNEC